MSDLYRADASNFTREQLAELINLQTNLHLEANKTIVVAKGKIEELEHKLELAIKALESIAKNTCCTPCQEAKKVAEKALEQLK